MNQPRISSRRRLSRRPIKLSTAIAVVALASVAITAVAASAFGYSLAQRSVSDEVTNSLRRDAKRLARSYINAGGEDRVPGRPLRIPVAVIDAGNRVVGASFDLSEPIDPRCAQVAAGTLVEHTTSLRVDGSTTQFLCVDLARQIVGNGPVARSKRDQAKGLAIMIGRDVDAAVSQQRNLAIGFVGIGAGTTVLSLLLALLASRYASRPLRRLVDTTTAISTDLDLVRTAPAEGPRELRELSESFNRMICALSDARAAQQRLIDDTVHELRTPITSLKTNVALLSRIEELPVEDRASVIEQIQSQFRELGGLIDDVHLLADQPGSTGPAPARLDLADVVRSALTRTESRRLGVNVIVSLEPTTIRGSFDDLERAVVNVLDNALKWSPPRGTVRVTLANGLLTVSDDGPGIAPSDRTRVFDRFYRADTARSKPGSGLGLAIVADVVERHRGTVWIDDNAGTGTTVSISLPSGPTPSRASLRPLPAVAL